ncbi:hypothetical protein NX059_011013 [Plenodomus lindquistii]|nr:hypothetical protein NX059_011013 [Plenodomus lindquistii]
MMTFLHSMLALLSLSTILALSTSALLPPQPRLPSHPRALAPPQIPIPSPSPTLDDKCTFILYQRTHPSTPDSTYIRIDTLTDHTNALTIDLALLRPREAFNSYARVSNTRVFTIAGLLDESELTIRGGEQWGSLVFESGGLVWGSESVEGGEGEAWCSAGKWSEGGEMQSRERIMDCAFPCGKIGDEEREAWEEERIELR